MRFLVVDDEPDLRMILQINLERWGHDVVLAASAAEAYDVLRAADVDAMLLDVSMPGESGLQLLGRLQADGLMPSEVALLSAALLSDGPGAVPTGVRHLAKPFGVDELEALIEEMAGP
ncbi:response regulator [Euzebya sp.]|uniref:response regulator n=1 Tax=Euzebya sp. TaxID=1971409 RepID=UPI0035197880